ncbi:MAG: ATP-binding cassette domain-containing protein [Chitinophagales bacterium]|nr:ATP-binding cassette domain-containing protein [Chitinophagales bacterium]
MITVKHVNKSYGNHQVLYDIQAAFEPGRVYGIVGENGAGKTTLFKCLLGLETYEGQVESKWQPLKDHLGYLPTESYFFPFMTGREYLQLVCNARKTELGDATEKNIFDLPLDEFAVHYSTGMKKKLALLGILLQPNEVFILDEPFNGVDIQSNILITEIILRLRSLGKTVLISSHIFSTLRDTCDEILLLQQGRITQKVAKADFDQLEREMKDVSIGDRVDRILGGST